MKWISNAIVLNVLLAVTGSAAGQSVEISPSSRLPLKVMIPISQKASGLLSISERDGRCVGQLTVGKQPPVELNFELPAPCDVMTRGASVGFAPRVKFDGRGSVPTAIRFRVVGSLRYHPEYRAECSKSWRDVVLQWPGPRMTFLDAYAEAHRDLLFCPRFYNDVKWWSAMDW
jgi:hypothetical protein